MAEILPAGIEELHQDDVAATLARDSDALAALWDQDGVLLQPGQPPIIGMTAFKEYLKQALVQSSSTEVLKYAPQIQDVQVQGDIAYEWGFFDSSVRSSDREQPTNFRARFIRILRRQLNGSWRFVRVMWAPE